MYVSTASMSARIAASSQPSRSRVAAGGGGGSRGPRPIPVRIQTDRGGMSVSIHQWLVCLHYTTDHGHVSLSLSNGESECVPDRTFQSSVFKSSIPTRAHLLQKSGIRNILNRTVACNLEHAHPELLPEQGRQLARLAAAWHEETIRRFRNPDRSPLYM